MKNKDLDQLKQSKTFFNQSVKSHVVRSKRFEGSSTVTEYNKDYIKALDSEIEELGKEG